jgi:CheY-like chemotaxis protein
MEHFAPLPHVLVVEDEPIIRVDLTEEFHDAGWSVLEAASAEEALALWQKQNSVDAAVIDINLAGNMDGLELADVLHAMGHKGSVLYVSGAPFDRKRMVPGSIFRPKPFSAPEVVRATELMMRGEGRA